jgi:hypothetical protein
MPNRQEALRNIFLNGLALLAITMSIFVMALHLNSSKRATTKTRYFGEGMALCHSVISPGDDGWITLEFTQFESVSKNTFQFTLRDGKKVEGDLPCMVNFDRKSS